MGIKNQSTVTEEHVNDMRGALEHRATWFYFLVDEARKRGLDPDDFAREAITRCGCFHGREKFNSDGDLKKFAAQFATELNKKIFEIDVQEISEKRFVVEFHYCPLVNAWLKQTKDEKEIEHLCDIAMDGDRGIVSVTPGFEMKLEDTIAGGGTCCRIVITKK
jgi:hypothetical protein